MGQRLLPAACQDERRVAEGRQFLALSLQQFSLLYLNQSMISLCLAAQGAIQRRSLDEITEGQVRRGQIRGRSLDEVCGLNPAGIQGGPGQIGIPNSDWSRIGDAVDAVGARRSEDAPLGYFCLTRWFQADFQEAANFYWPLTSSGSPHWLLGKPNSYWLMTQAGLLAQPRGMLSFHWWKTQAAFAYDDEAVTSLEACERRLGAAYFPDSLKVQGRSGRHGIEWEEEWGHVPSSDTFPTVVGSQLLLHSRLQTPTGKARRQKTEGSSREDSPVWKEKTLERKEKRKGKGRLRLL